MQAADTWNTPTLRGGGFKKLVGLFQSDRDAVPGKGARAAPTELVAWKREVPQAGGQLDQQAGRRKFKLHEQYCSTSTL